MGAEWSCGWNQVVKSWSRWGEKYELKQFVLFFVWAEDFLP